MLRQTAADLPEVSAPASCHSFLRSKRITLRTGAAGQTSAQTAPSLLLAKLVASATERQSGGSSSGQALPLSVAATMLLRGTALEWDQWGPNELIRRCGSGSWRRGRAAAAGGGSQEGLAPLAGRSITCWSSWVCS